MDLLDFEAQGLYFEQDDVAGVKELLAQAAEEYSSGLAELPLLQAYFCAGFYSGTYAAGSTFNNYFLIVWHCHAYHAKRQIKNFFPHTLSDQWFAYQFNSWCSCYYTGT